MPNASELFEQSCDYALRIVHEWCYVGRTRVESDGMEFVETLPFVAIFLIQAEFNADQIQNCKGVIRFLLDDGDVQIAGAGEAYGTWRRSDGKIIRVVKHATGETFDVQVFVDDELVGGMGGLVGSKNPDSKALRLTEKGIQQFQNRAGTTTPARVTVNPLAESNTRAMDKNTIFQSVYRRSGELLALLEKHGRVFPDRTAHGPCLAKMYKVDSTEGRIFVQESIRQLQIAIYNLEDDDRQANDLFRKIEHALREVGERKRDCPIFRSHEINVLRGSAGLYSAPQPAPLADPIQPQLNREAVNPGGSGKAKPRTKPGRKPDTDFKKDRQISDAWETGQYKSFAELEQALDLKQGDARRAMDRHRKRQPT